MTDKYLHSHGPETICRPSCPAYAFVQLDKHEAEKPDHIVTKHSYGFSCHSCLWFVNHSNGYMMQDQAKVETKKPHAVFTPMGDYNPQPKRVTVFSRIKQLLGME